MNKPYNVELLFSKPAVPDTSFEEKDIFKKAALIYDFDLEKDFADFNQVDIELLKEKANIKNDGKYYLSNELRKTILTERIGVNNIENEIKINNITSEFTTTLQNSLTFSNQIVKNLTSSELFFQTKIAEILPIKIDTDELKVELERRLFFSPFERLTINFAGRKKELEQISEYVDWLPKTGIFNKISSGFRNLINWHDKKPLLIQGIGGIGKSTLVAKFILEQNNEKANKKLPFVYIDFDLVGFSINEPLNILIESLRQMSLQFPKQQALFSRISASISNKIFNPNQQNIQSSKGSDRGIVYNDIESIIGENNLEVSMLKMPILIVFDSFEEIQHRSTEAGMVSFFSFIKEISEKVPRIRPIFVGRSEIDETISKFSFEKIEILQFDKESCDVLLEKYGIADKKTRDFIFNNFGGNPLILQLATSLAKTDLQGLMSSESIQNKAKQDYLVNRILEHIHDSEVRKIAMPGMLIRTINPEIIKEVLAEACGLGKITIEKASDLFEALKKEVALISKSGGENNIEFRQDLRMTCEPMILTKYPNESTLIRQKAIDYYKNREGGENQAEYYFHWLKSGSSPSELTKSTYLKIRTYLESSIIELPENAKLHIKTLLGSRVSENTLENSSNLEWENYYSSLIKEALHGELEYLKNLKKEIEHRKERSFSIESELPIYEAFLYQRLNDLEKSNEIINKFLKQNLESKTSLHDRLLLIKIQNLEYQFKSKEATKIIEHNFSTIFEDNSSLKDSFFEPNMEKQYMADKIKILRLRNLCRIGSYKSLNYDQLNLSHYLPENNFEVNWNYFLTELKSTRNPEFLSENDFLKQSADFRKNTKDFKILEDHCYTHLNVFLKDIAMTGELEIVMKDFLYVIELKGLRVQS